MKVGDYILLDVQCWPYFNFYCSENLLMDLCNWVNIVNPFLLRGNRSVKMQVQIVFSSFHSFFQSKSCCSFKIYSPFFVYPVDLIKIHSFLALIVLAFTFCLQIFTKQDQLKDSCKHFEEEMGFNMLVKGWTADYKVNLMLKALVLRVKKVNYMFSKEDLILLEQ